MALQAWRFRGQTATRERARFPARVFGFPADSVVNHAMHQRLLSRIMPDYTFGHAEGDGHMPDHFVPDRIIAAVEAATASLAGRNEQAPGPS